MYLIFIFCPFLVFFISILIDVNVLLFQSHPSEIMNTSQNNSSPKKRHIFLQSCIKIWVFECVLLSHFYRDAIFPQARAVPEELHTLLLDANSLWLKPLQGDRIQCPFDSESHRHTHTPRKIKFQWFFPPSASDFSLPLFPPLMSAYIHYLRYQSYSYDKS